MNSVTRCTGLITAALLLGIPTGSRAQEAAVQQDRKWQVDLDLAGVLMHSSATVDVAGMRIPGASANVSNAVTGAFGLSYSLTPSIAIELEAGIPARATITGAGSIAPFGTIATTRYGAGILSVQYRFVGLGHFETESSTEFTCPM